MTRTKSRAILLASATLVLPHIASAALLAGFHDFDNLVNTEGHDEAAPGITGLVIDGSPERSVTIAGSTDGTYGPSIPVTGSSVNDGYLRSIGDDIPLTEGNPVIQITFDYDPLSGGPSYYVLSTLLFDAAKQQAPPGTITVWYSLDGADFAAIDSSLISPNNVVGAPYSIPDGASADYKDYTVDLSSLGLKLVDGSVVQFLFDMDPNGRLDNIALTSIPETSGAVALGGLLGVGLLMRKRRRFRSAK